MGTTFWKLLQNMNEEEDAALLDGGEESKAMRVVRTGVGLRQSKSCGNFWDDFIAICNDGEGLAELLNVPSEKVGSWASKIQEILDKVESADDQETSKKKAEVVPTGITTIGADASPGVAADLQPTP